MSTLEERIANLSPEKRQRLLEQLKKQDRASSQAQPVSIQRIDRTAEPLPLSFGQQRLWFLEQFEPGNVAYNIPGAYLLEGEINLPALERSLSEIVRRHEVLRTNYRDVNGNPELCLQESWHFHLSVKDVSPLSSAARSQTIERLMQEETQRPFDLKSDLLLRATALRETDERTILLLTLHHIAGDGWSFGVLLRELGAIYNAFIADAPSPLEELAIQYVDYAHWQRRTLEGQELTSQLEYWKPRLAPMPTLLELPTDHPRPPLRTYGGRAFTVSIPGELAAALHTLSKQEDVTFFMTLLTAFQVLLSRYSGQNEIAVGSPIANRTQTEIEGLIGFFVNTLVFTTTLDPAWTFSDALKQTRAAALGGYAHQAIPFERLVDELRPERNPSHNPLFQVLFALQNTPPHRMQIANLAVTPLETATTSAKFDLSLSLVEDEDGLNGILEYSTDLFERATMERFFAHFLVLLEGIVQHPTQRLVDLPLLTAAEHRLFVDTWNDTATEYPCEPLLPDLVAEQARCTPEGVAVIFQDQRLTYRELEARANQLAHYLRTLGVGRETFVGISVYRSLEMVIGILGILKAGATYVPLDPTLPLDRLSYMLAEALPVSENCPPVLLTQSTIREQLPDFSGRVICLDDDWPQISQMSPVAPCQIATPDTVMYVLYTSGSTGKPKGVMVPHRGVNNRLHWMSEAFPLTREDRVLQKTPFNFDISVWEFFLPLMQGATLVMALPDGHRDPDYLSTLIAEQRITLAHFVPSMLHIFLESTTRQDYPALKWVVCSGEALGYDLQTRFFARFPGVELHNLYGPTEASIDVTAWRCEPQGTQPTVPIGRPIANMQTYVLDAHLQPMPVGVPGELYLGGVGLARGYFQRPDTTADRFLPDPFSPQPGARVYRTGDLVRYRGDGAIEFLGRLDHQVKIRGFRIELGEIESVLNQHPAVQASVVVAREDIPGDKRLVAYVVSAQNEPPAPGDLRAYLKQQLPEYMVPPAIMVLDAFPVTPNGKLDRRALPAPDLTRTETPGDVVAPRNELETRILAIWSEVLGIEKLGIDENFFDLGGESFKAVRAVRKISDSLGVMQLFLHPTIRQLAESMADEKEQGPSRLLQELTPPVDAGKRAISLVCVPFAGGSPIMYQPMAKAMPGGVSLFAIEVPGHDFGLRDEPLQALAVVAARCVQEIQERVPGPIALFGHCLGGALAIEMARQLEAIGRPLVGVFIAGHFPTPRLPGRFFELLHRLFPSEKWTSRHTILEFLRAMGFFTEVVNPQEQAFVVHNLQQEVSEINDYYTKIYQSTDAKLKAPIQCIMGEMDRSTELFEERYKEWEFFSDSVNLATIPKAGHYFPKYQASEVAALVTEQVAQWQQVPETSGVAQTSEVPERSQLTTRFSERQAATPSLAAFFTVAIGQLISLIGTGLTTFALGVWVYQETGSLTAYALVMVFALLPAIAVIPFGGAVADRFDRKKIMLVCDSVAGAISATIAILLATHALQLWEVYLLASFAAITVAFQQPAYLAAVTQLAPKRYYGRANGIVQLGSGAGALLAPLMGGLLAVLIGLSGVIFIDMFTFLFAVSATLLVRFPNSLWRKQEEPFLKGVIGGWHYVWKRHGLLSLVLFTTVANYIFAITDVLITPLVLSLGSVQILGIVLAANGAGVVAGSLVMGIWGGTRRRVNGIIASNFLLGLSCVMIGIRADALFPALGLFGTGFAVAVINAHWLTVIQNKVGMELQGRVVSINLMLVMAMVPLGFITASPLADGIFNPLASGQWASLVHILVGTGPGRGIGLMLVLAGLLIVVWTIAASQYRPIRYLEDDLPDVFADPVIEQDKDLLQYRADQLLLERQKKH